MDKVDDQENIRRIRFLELTEKKRRDMEQLEMELGNFKVLQAIRKSQEKRNKEARKSFFRIEEWYSRFLTRKGSYEMPNSVNLSSHHSS